MFFDKLDRWPTIEQIFNDMASAEKLEDTQFTRSIQEKDVLPEFDNLYGFPKSYFLNRSSRDCDSELMSITEFRLLETGEI